MNDNGDRINLDRTAAGRAQCLIGNAMALKNKKKAKERANAADTMVTKALGVIQENGLYASALFLKSRKGEEAPLADVVMEEMLNLIEDLSTQFGFDWGKTPDVKKSGNVLAYLNDVVSAKLERLLLTKETLERMLIYARYGAKARSAEEG